MERCDKCDSVRWLPSPKPPGAAIKEINHMVEINFKGTKVAVNLQTLRAASKVFAALVKADKAELPSEVSKASRSWHAGSRTVVSRLTRTRPVKCKKAPKMRMRRSRTTRVRRMTNTKAQKKTLGSSRSINYAKPTRQARSWISQQISSMQSWDRIIDEVVEPLTWSYWKALHLARILSMAFEPGTKGRLFAMEWLFHSRFRRAREDGSFDFQLAEFVEASKAPGFRLEFLHTVFRGQSAGDLLPWKVFGKCRYREDRDPVHRLVQIVERQRESETDEDWDL
ncbi:hypothetical protein LTR27_010908 [Elasticomyces elasticus]|nr:hypothetical protein LTR27_010908 [Elasticomyces elasticus]